MTSKPPPVPPDNRSPKGTGSDPKPEAPASTKPDNLEQTGERANIRQNTTNQDFKNRR